MSANSARTGPIFVVGQPRSGSTITTRVLNEADGLFVINDFYALQAIDAEGLWGCANQQEAGRIAQIVFERIEIRATQETGKTLNQSIDLDGPAVEELRSLSTGPWRYGIAWHEVVDTMLSKAAGLAGCERWGWNTPQDHLHLDRLFAAWPDAKALFVLRDPHAVLRSYKNVSGPWHDGRRYNPATIGYAWKAAAKSYLRRHASAPGQVYLLRYEELVEDTPAALAKLGEFLGVDFGGIDLETFGRNSSHSAGRASKTVYPAELWVAERVIGEMLNETGFRSGLTGSPAKGALELARTMLGSGMFIAGQILTDRDRRRRALNFLRKG